MPWWGWLLVGMPLGVLAWYVGCFALILWAAWNDG